MRRTPGVTGQTSSLQVETTTSAQASSSASSLRGTSSRRRSRSRERLDDLRMRRGAGLAAGRARLVPAAGGPAEEALGHQASGRCWRRRRTARSRASLRERRALAADELVGERAERRARRAARAM